MAMNASIDEVR